MCISASCILLLMQIHMLRDTIKGNYCSYPAMDFDPIFML